MRQLLLIYSEHITPRVEYIFRLLLEDIAGTEIQLTGNKEEYYAFNGPSLNYSYCALKDHETYIKPNGFLFTSEVQPCQALVSKRNGSILLFLNSSHSDQLCFDPFAASFYLVSRYEEYFSYTPDEFDRFTASSSVLYQNNLLEVPLVNMWANEIKNKLVAAFPQLAFEKKIFSSIVTVDIDQAYAFKGRGLKRNFFSFIKNLLHFNFNFLSWQTKAILKNRDPYDSYAFLKRVQSNTRLPFIYFINVGRYSKYDKNLSFKNSVLKQLLQTIKDYASIGLHPSYYSNNAKEKLCYEKQSLEAIVAQPIVKSRQHYLKLKFPQTYRSLLEVGITEDYSMGFASHPGFRAGVCTPFYWFDLERNHVTALKIFPITYMEGSLGEDLKMTPAEAEEKMNTLTETVKAYNGCHISIWHNHTVNDLFFWKDWKAVFERTTNKLKAG